MTALWNGLPPDPDQDSHHWIGPRTASFPAQWIAAKRTWVWGYGQWLIPAGYVPPEVAQVVADEPNAWVYHGPCERPPEPKSATPTRKHAARAKP